MTLDFVYEHLTPDNFDRVAIKHRNCIFSYTKIKNPHYPINKYNPLFSLFQYYSNYWASDYEKRYASGEVFL